MQVFNGRGTEFAGAVESVGRHRASVRLQEYLDPQPEISVAVTLAQAVLKGDKMDDVVRDAVMMGVAIVQPIVTTRTETSVASLQRSHRQERWQRIAVSAAKQSGRAIVPDVRKPCTFQDAVMSLDTERPARKAYMFVEPSAGVGVVPVSDLAKPPGPATMLVGPEGGWTPEEISQCSKCCELVTLGSRTLRADSVALVAFTALLTQWKEL